MKKIKNIKQKKINCFLTYLLTSATFIFLPTVYAETAVKVTPETSVIMHNEPMVLTKKQKQKRSFIINVTEKLLTNISSENRELILQELYQDQKLDKIKNQKKLKTEIKKALLKALFKIKIHPENVLTKKHTDFKNQYNQVIDKHEKIDQFFAKTVKIIESLLEAYLTITQVAPTETIKGVINFLQHCNEKDIMFNMVSAISKDYIQTVEGAVVSEPSRVALDKISALSNFNLPLWVKKLDKKVLLELQRARQDGYEVTIDDLIHLTTACYDSPPGECNLPQAVKDFRASNKSQKRNIE